MQYCLQHYISNKYIFIKILYLTYQTTHTLDWIYNIHKKNYGAVILDIH